MQEQRIQFALNAITCQSRHPAQLVCMKNGCQAGAFICSQDNCKCETDHKKCTLSSLSTFVYRIAKKRTAAPKKTSEALDTVVKMYEDLIDELSIKKEAIERMKLNYGLSEDQMHFLQLIEEGNKKQISGHFCNQLCQRVKFSSIKALIVQREGLRAQDEISKSFQFIRASFDKISKLARSENDLCNIKLAPEDMYYKCVADEYYSVSSEASIKTPDLNPEQLPLDTQVQIQTQPQFDTGHLEPLREITLVLESDVPQMQIEADEIYAVEGDQQDVASDQDQ